MPPMPKKKGDRRNISVCMTESKLITNYRWVSLRVTVFLIFLPSFQPLRKLNILSNIAKKVSLHSEINNDEASAMPLPASRKPKRATSLRVSMDAVAKAKRESHSFDLVPPLVPPPAPFFRLTFKNFAWVRKKGAKAYMVKIIILHGDLFAIKNV